MATRSYFEKIGVEWLSNLNLKAKLFLKLASQALRRRFTKFDLATGKFPLVSLILKQDDSPIWRDQDAFDRYFEHECPIVDETVEKVQESRAGRMSGASMPPSACPWKADWHTK
jgi:hypothetical protein